MIRLFISTICMILFGSSFLTPAPAAPLQPGAAKKAGGKAKPGKKNPRANRSYARFANREYAVKYLNKKGIAVNDMEAELIRQMQDGQLETAAALVGAGARLNQGDAPTFSNSCPFLQAAIHGNAELLKLMVSKGADIQCKVAPRGGKEGFTAQYAAVIKDNLDTLRYLDSIGLSCLTSVGSTSVLAHAALFGAYNCFKYIIDHGGNPHETYPDGANLMHRAAAGGNLQIIKYLESKGISIRDSHKKGAPNMLLLASVNKRHDAVQYFLEKGADPFLDTGTGYAPIVPIVCMANTGTLQKLEKLGVDFQNPPEKGASYLESAAMADNPEAVRYLISKGLRVNDLNRIRIGRFDGKDLLEDTQKTRNMRELIQTLQAD